MILILVPLGKTIVALSKPWIRSIGLDMVLTLDFSNVKLYICTHTYICECTTLVYQLFTQSKVQDLKRYKIKNMYAKNRNELVLIISLVSLVSQMDTKNIYIYIYAHQN